MADDQVKYSELVFNDNDNFRGLIEALNQVKAKLAELRTEASGLRGELRGASTATRQQQQSTAENAKSAEDLSRRVKQLTDEEARLKAAIAEANRMQKLQAQASTAAEGSLNEMRAKYKLLVAEMGNYNLKTAEGRRKMQATSVEARKLRDEIYKLEAAYGQFGRNVGNYTGALSRFGARLKEAAARFVAFNAAFLSFTGLIRFGRALFEVRKELESSLVTFKALAGEVQGAKLFEEMKEFAFTTPVTLDAAAKATQTMLSFGVAQEKVIDIMKRLGDISAGDGDRLQRLALAYSQATQAGRLMGQDTLQFINSGFNPLYYISLRTGKSMMELRGEMQKAKIPIEMVTQAIIDATSEGGQFNGMLEKQKETMRGAANIMSGAWQNMLNEMGAETQGVIVGVLKWLTQVMQNWRESIRTLRQVAVSIGTAKAALLLYRVAVEAAEKATEAETAALAANSGAATANAAAATAATKANKGWLAVTKLLTVAVKGLGKALKSFLPFAIISGVTMLVQKLIDARREMKQLVDYTEEFAEVQTDMNREMGKEMRQLNALFGELQNVKRGTDAFQAAKQNIIDNFGKYHSKLSEELTDVSNLDLAYRNLKIAVENSYKARARQSFMEKSEARLSESEVKLREELNEFVEENTNEYGEWSTKKVKGMVLPRAIYNNVNHYLEYGEWLDGQVASMLINGRLDRGLGKAALKYQTALRGYKKANRRADALWGPYTPPETTPGYTPVTTGGGADDGSKKSLKDVDFLESELLDKEAVIELENAYERRLAMLAKEEEKERQMLLEKYERESADLEYNRKHGLITEAQYQEQRATLDKNYNDLVKTNYEGNFEEMGVIQRKYWNKRNEITAKEAERQEKEAEKQAKEEEKIAKESAKAQYDALAEEWEKEQTAMVERGAKKRELIAAEIAAEINRLQTMLTVQRSLNGEIMTDEERAKIEEWIKLLTELQKKGNFGGLGIGQVFGKGAENVAKKTKGNYTSVIDILFPDWDSDKQNALKGVFDQAKEALNSWMDARKAAADQAKELADDEVSSAESALEREIELRNQGYANDVALRERELADAKATQRKAAEEQKKVAKEQILLDAAMQTSSMITASANILKQFPNPLAWVPMLATMWGAFAYAKVQAYNAAEKSIKFREGGAMLLEGGSHESGHDVDLGVGPDGSNLRAEGGEYFAVINKRNSRKYGSEIPGIVNALNSGRFEEKYIRTTDAAGIMPAVAGVEGGAVDLSAVESGVSELVRQGEKSWSQEGEFRVMRYKNLTRRVRG